MQLVVGLGNPGTRYAKTRHNVGFMLLNSLCDRWELKANLGAVVCKRGRVLYAKPQTFMNLSGVAVTALARYFKTAICDIIVVYDDKDMTFGKIRYRADGSSGGHNGMKSIIASLGTEQIARLKIGVAPTMTDVKINDTAEYVLAKFTAVEAAALPTVLQTAQVRLDGWLNKNAH
jgi:PTH1 family peptidyl-tRNA hydrolase